jgi:hypothetical protein
VLWGCENVLVRRTLFLTFHCSTAPIRFIAQIQSVRGQDRLLIGNNTSKVDKKLDIPPAIARKPRPVDILSATGDPRGSNAQVGDVAAQNSGMELKVFSAISAPCEQFSLRTLVLSSAYPAKKIFRS